MADPDTTSKVEQKPQVGPPTEVAPDTGSRVRDLMAKGDGVLVRRGTVWALPGAQHDSSGTNLQLPAEYVSDEEVQTLLASGDLVPVTRSTTNELLSVRLKDDSDVRVLSTAQAGTAEAATEAPLNYRPTHDAGSTPPTPAEAAELAATSIRTALAGGSAEQPKEGDAKGSEPSKAAPAKAAGK